MNTDKILGALAGYGYADARLELSTRNSVRLNDAEIDAVSGSSSGISVRVLKNGSWGFASSNVKKESDVSELLRRAERLASLSKGRTKLADLKLKSADVKAKGENPAHIAIEEKIRKLKDSAKHIEGGRIKNRLLSLSDEFVEKTFLSSEGIMITQRKAYAYLSCTAIAKKGELMQRGSERSASSEGYGKIKFHESAEAAGEKAERLIDAKPPPAGRMTAVLNPEMTGVFSHEALGHATEADSIVERESLLRGKLGKKIGNELVNIADDPTAKDFGNYVFDDEGVQAKKAVLVKNGVLRGYINSRENCDAVKVEANGHARAEDYSAFPIVRMSNTYFQPGKSSHGDVFDIKNGIYLKGMRGGSVDIFAGGFMFKAEEAYEVRNGELGALYRDTAFSGNILETLRNVEAVGKDFGTSPGFCGKSGQSVPVSDGGPHIRVKDVKIG